MTKTELSDELEMVVTLTLRDCDGNKQLTKEDLDRVRAEVNRILDKASRDTSRVPDEGDDAVL